MRDSTIRIFRIVETEGSRQVTRNVGFYNLDAVICSMGKMLLYLISQQKYGLLIPRSRLHNRNYLSQTNAVR